MIPILIAGPAVEPVAVDDMRAFLRLDDAAEDGLITALIKAARQWVEGASGRLLIAQTWRCGLERWPEDRVVDLPLSPLISIESIRVFDIAGAAVTVSPLLYHLDPASDPAVIVVDTAAPEPGRAMHGIEIDVRAGYGPAGEDVPAPLRQAIRMLGALWFENRGDQLEPVRSPPGDVLALIAPSGERASSRWPRLQEAVRAPLS